MMVYKKNQIVFYIQPINKIRKATVINVHGEFCTIRFHDTGGGMNVRVTKLYSTEEIAKQHLKLQKSPEEKQKDRNVNDRIKGYKEYW